MMDKIFLMYFVVPISLGVGILLVGAVLLAIDSRRHKKFEQVETQGWETTGGKVTAARLDECLPQPGNKKGVQPEPAFKPVVEFVYTANGMEYTGNNIFPGDCENFSQAAAQAFLDKYPVNAYVPVLFNPEDPAKAALEDQPRRTNRMRMIGLLFTWFGICVCCFTSLMTFVIAGNIL
jgi:hypothetical protein